MNNMLQAGSKIAQCGTTSDATVLKFESQKQQFALYRCKLGANPCTPRDATAQFNSIRSHRLVYSRHKFTYGFSIGIYTF